MLERELLVKSIVFPQNNTIIKKGEILGHKKDQTRKRALFSHPPSHFSIHYPMYQLSSHFKTGINHFHMRHQMPTYNIKLNASVLKQLSLDETGILKHDLTQHFHYYSHPDSSQKNTLAEWHLLWHTII